MSGDSMTANHVEHKIATFPRITGAGRIGVPCRPAIAYSRVDTGRNPSAVPSNSNFPAAHLGSQLGLIARSYRAFSSPPLGRPTRLPRQGDLLPPSAHAFAGVVGLFEHRSGKLKIKQKLSRR